MKQRIISLLLTSTLLLIGIGSLLINFPLTHTAAGPVATTTVFYDGSLGGTPDTQDMEYESYLETSVQSFASGATTLDTTASMLDGAGYGITETLIPTLDRSTGFKLNFSLQIESEDHGFNTDRAGFSVILLAQDNQGIEIDFWEDEVWAQEGGIEPALFTHDEGVAFDTTTGIIDYELEIVNDTYTLTAPAMTTLTGPVRNYTAFEPLPGFPDPYEVPNFVFLGDNSSSGQSRIKLSYVSVTTETAVTPTNTPTPTHTATATSTPTSPSPGSTATPTSTSTVGAPVDSTATPTNTPTATPTPDHTLFLPFVLDS